jgi:hypothetical protein
MPAPPMMSFTTQNRSCHPERNEGSRCPAYQILRCAQDDILLPILIVKIHYRPIARRCPPQADTSAARQYIVRLRGIADLGREHS